MASKFDLILAIWFMLLAALFADDPILCILDTVIAVLFWRSYWATYDKYKKGHS